MTIATIVVTAYLFPAFVICLLKLYSDGQGILSMIGEFTGDIIAFYRAGMATRIFFCFYISIGLLVGHLIISIFKGIFWPITLGSMVARFRALKESPLQARE